MLELMSEELPETGNPWRQGDAAPTPVGDYARQLKQGPEAPPSDDPRRNHELQPVTVQIYFELRDERGGVPGTMWKREFDALGLPAGTVRPVHR